jgi:hypothetical protein
MAVLDRSPEMIMEAKRRTPGNVNCVLADVLTDPLPGAASATARVLALSPDLAETPFVTGQ